MIFEPQIWHSCDEHDWKLCTEGVNCYSYALNNRNYYWSVPGLGFAHTQGKKYMDSFDVYFEDISFGKFQESLISGAVRDGLIKVEHSEDRVGYYLTALFLSKDKKDFHWYRKDDNGFWSNKDGWRRATNKDNNDNLISDPREIKNSPYTVFGGYFLVPLKGISLKENFPLKT